jgi:hypothetical protein
LNNSKENYRRKKRFGQACGLLFYILELAKNWQPNIEEQLQIFWMMAILYFSWRGSGTTSGWKALS